MKSEQIARRYLGRSRVVYTYLRGKRSKAEDILSDLKHKHHNMIASTYIVSLEKGLSKLGRLDDNMSNESIIQLMLEKFPKFPKYLANANFEGFSAEELNRLEKKFTFDYDYSNDTDEVEKIASWLCVMAVRYILHCQKELRGVGVKYGKV